MSNRLIPKLLQEDYTSRCGIDQIKEFMNSPAWKDIQDIMEADLLAMTNQLQDPLQAPDLNVINYVRGEINRTETLVDLPNMMIEQLESQLKQEKEQQDD